MKTWGDSGASPKTRPSSLRTPLRVFIAALATFLIVGLGSNGLLPGLRPTPRIYIYNPPVRPIEWDSLKATKSFEFHRCYDEFQCARLKLPLDYFNGTYPESFIGLAITKLPAKVPVDDPRYGGPVLINPGGPGGPGALFALREAKILQDIVDSAVDPKADIQPDDFLNTEKYYDIIGFDPRGIGWTDPGVACMPDEASFWSWRLREQTEGILGSSNAAMGRLWSMNHAYGSSCKQATDDEDGPDAKQYVTTASVARDMLEIVDRHAEWATEKIAQQATGRVRCDRGRNSKPKELPKLHYWGFSYGTYLGSTFASMFPDRVGRLILDGVVSSDDYNAGLGNGSLHDTEKAMASFYTFCLNSGPEICPLTTATSDVKGIEERVQRIVQSLYHNPIQVSSSYGPDILTYSDVKMGLFSALYQPMLAFPLVAKFLAAVEEGGGSIISEYVSAARPQHVYSCPANGSMPNKEKYFSDVATIAILCSDGRDLTGTDINAFEEYVDLLMNISPTSGGIWSALRMKCASWKIKALHRFGDDFGANTSHPILFISNTADPVTPLRSGKVMSSKFPGSSLLVQDSAGHCSVSTPSPCTLLYIRAYFQTGAIPQPNTLCVPPATAFSLNSTSPTSPFYDPDLANAVRALDPVNMRLYMGTYDGKKMMNAAAALQKGAAGRRYFGFGGIERMR